MKTVIAKTIAIVLALVTILGTIPVFADSTPNLDDGIPKRLDSRCAVELCLNIQYGVPATAVSANFCLDPGKDNQPNELFMFDRIESGPYKGSYYIYCIDLNDLNKEMSVNAFNGAGCSAGSVLKGFVSDAANQDHSSDPASLWWVNAHNGYFTLTNVASGLNIDTYGSTTIGDYVRLWYPDGSAEQDFIITDYVTDMTGTVKTKSTVRFRASAPSGTTLAFMPNGATVTILDNGKTVSGFYHINYNGMTGWASADYITINSTNSGTSTNATRSITSVLYGGNGGRLSCAYDGYVTLRQQYGYRHEGIDFVNYSGASVYSLIDGVITKVTKGSSSSLSTVAIYDEAADKTVIYLHLAPASGLTAGTRVSVGTYLGSESSRGAGGTVHTHVEVRDGYRTAAAVSKDKTLVNPDPTAYWNSKGYTAE